MGVLSVEQQQRAARARRRGVTVDGIRFDDRRQANLFVELRTLQRAGTITELKVNPRFPLTVNGVRVDTYTPHFSYKRDGKPVLVDVANWQTDLRRLQKKLAEAIYEVKVTDG